jgi:Tfp pilus assembly protein PilZ
MGQKGRSRVAAAIQVLEIEYGNARDFTQDYQANLSNGGAFVATRQTLDLRQFVIVRLRLPWLNRMIDLEGEVVHIVPAEVSGVGGRPGVAVQFREPPAGIRGRLGPLCEAQPAPAPPPAPSGEERVAQRKATRVPVHVETASGGVRGRTRNLSRSGVLVDVQEGTAALEERAKVVLTHPSRSQELTIEGTVVRVAASGGRVAAIAVQFDKEAAGRNNVVRFIESLQETEHTRRLGAISGPIAELGPRSIVQMFATTARRGTIFLRNGEEEGMICFDNGLLRVVRMGPLSGLKALVRMLCWTQGSFEFHSGLEEAGNGDAPLPLEAALSEAARSLDERSLVDASAFPLQARLVARHTKDGQFTGVLSKVEEALLDVAQAGFTVQRALEVIPEPDTEVFRALRTLIDTGMLELR